MLGKIFKKKLINILKQHFFFMNSDKNNSNWPKDLFELNIKGSLEIGYILDPKKIGE